MQSAKLTPGQLNTGTVSLVEILKSKLPNHFSTLSDYSADFGSWQRKPVGAERSQFSMHIGRGRPMNRHGIQHGTGIVLPAGAPVYGGGMRSLATLCMS